MRLWFALLFGMALLSAGCIEGLAPPGVPGDGFECRDGTITSAPDLCSPRGALAERYTVTPEPLFGQPFNAGFRFELLTQKEFHIPDCYTPFTERLPGIGVFVGVAELPPDATVTIGAELGRFAGYAQSLVETRQFGERTGYLSRVFIRAPRCTRGADDVIITARVCGTPQDGRFTCVRLAKRTHVYVHSCQLCERYTEWTPAPECNSTGCYTIQVPIDERLSCTPQNVCTRTLDRHYACSACERPPIAGD